MYISNVGNILGAMICGFGSTLFLPLFVSLIYNDGTRLSSFYSMLLTWIIGLFCFFFFKKETNKSIQPKEAMLLVSLAWFSLSLLGALPFLLSDTLSFFDALFETASALTTTGASVINDLEALPQSLLLWRCFMQWLGGMGIVVFSIALMPFLGKNTLQVFHAEVPGVITDKVKPKLKDTALFLWKGYCLLTITCFFALFLAGMDIFDAIAHTFSTVSTGGFSTKNSSVASFSPIIQWILIFFMGISGINFALLFFSNSKDGLLQLLRDPESKCYFLMIALSTLFIVILLHYSGTVDSSIFDTIRIVCFQVVSIITTTGFIAVDYSLWPAFTLLIILFLTFTGGSGGSTSGGFKVLRVIILSKLSSIGFIKRIHPNAVQAIKINNFVISEQIFLSVALFFILYMSVLFVGTCVISLCGVDLVTSFTAVLTCVSNVGPGLGSVGPVDTFAHLPAFVKMILSFLMIVGRLELYTVLILFFPLFWRV